MVANSHKVKFAPFMLFQQPPGGGDDQTVIRGQVDSLVEAEAMGYDGAFVAEHFFSPYSLATSPAALVGAIAARTRTIKIGTAITVLPLQHPLRTAADWATLDVLSEGRTVLGVGRGYNWYEFDSLGIDLTENTERFIEAHEIIRRAWTEEWVTFHGKYYDIVATQVLPKPVQDPPPPMFYAGSGSHESVAMAAEGGMGICVGAQSGPEALNKTRQTWLQLAAEAGHSEAEMQRILENTPTTQRIVWVADTDEQAEREARVLVEAFNDLFSAYAYPGHGYPERNHPEELPQSQARKKRAAAGGNQNWDAMMETYGLLVGSPATVRTRIQDLVEQAPVDYILMWSGIGGPDSNDMRRNLSLFADKVMPHFK